MGALALDGEQTFLPHLQLVGPWRSHEAVLYPWPCLPILRSVVVPSHHPGSAPGLPHCQNSLQTSMTLYRFILFHKNSGLLQTILSTFDCTSAIANCWLENLLYINRICLMEKNYWGKCFFQPTEPNASQQQKRVKRGEKMENIKSSVTS